VCEREKNKLFETALLAVRSLGTGKPFGELFPRIAAALMTEVGAESCLLAVLGGESEIEAVRGVTIEGQKIRNPRVALSHFLVRSVIRSRKEVFVSDARRDRRWRSEEDLRLKRQVFSLLGVPVFKGDRLAGVLAFAHRSVPIARPRLEGIAFLLAQLLGPLLPEEARAREEKPTARREEAGSRSLLEEVYVWRGFETRSASLKEVLETARRAAASEIPILIVGEDGTGKGLLARAVHEESGRKGRFVTASSSTIPRSLIEAELFGYVPGAFTGAEVERRGLIAEAEGGTLFIDDLAEMPDAMQAALLRVLAEGVVRQLGSDVPRRIDFRLIAAASSPPEELVRERSLREDLLYRLKGVTLSLPALRDRPEDIRLLFDRRLERFASGAVPVLTEEAERFLLLHPWPGNVRELVNEARRICALGIEEIKPEDLSFAVPEEVPPGADPHLQRPLPEVIKQTERAEIERALALTGGNKSRAARLLGITRRSLYRRLQDHGLL